MFANVECVLTGLTASHSLFPACVMLLQVLSGTPHVANKDTFAIGFVLGSGSVLVVASRENTPESDGLEAIRAAFSHPESEMVMFLKPSTESELRLHRQWQQLSADVALDLDVSLVHPIVVNEVLSQIGVPAEDRQALATRLGTQPCVALLEAAITAQQATQTLRGQLDGMGFTWDEDSEFVK